MPDPIQLSSNAHDVGDWGEPIAWEQEQRRLDALRSYGVFETAPEADYDDITALAARICGMPIAVISLVGRDKQWLKSTVGTTISETPRSWALCNTTIRSKDLTIITDTHQEPRFNGHPLVVGDPHIRFYAGAPLLMPSGFVLGALCVIDRVPRALTTEQRLALEALSRQVVIQLELRKQNAALNAKMQELQAEQDLKEQLTANSPLGVSLYDELGNCILANEALARQTGASRSQLLAVNLHSNDALKESGIYKLALQSWHSGKALSDVFFHRSSFGRELWMRVDVSVIKVRGHRMLALMTDDVTEIKRKEEAHWALQADFEKLFTNSLDGVLRIRPREAILSANPAACEQLGLTEQQIVTGGRERIFDLTDPRLTALLEQQNRHGKARGEVTMIRGNGERFEVEVSTSLYLDREGRPLASAIFRDITERKLLERKVQDGLTLLNNLAQRVPGVIYQYRRFPDGRTCYPFASDGLHDMFEVSPEEVREDSSVARSRIHPDDQPLIERTIKQSFDTLEPWSAEFRVVLPEQGLRWREGSAQPERLSDGSVLWHGYIADVTSRKAGDATTLRLAYYDSLTGLPNRARLLDCIEESIVAAKRSGQYGALLFLDLDNFKRINDARGHSVGDAVLAQAAARISGIMGPGDTVARLGGDEFVMLAVRLGSDMSAAIRTAVQIAERLRASLESVYEVGDGVYSLTGSIGVTMFPKYDEHTDDLLREADTAMYRAKVAGRNGIAFFETGMRSEVEERLAIEHDLKGAVAAGQLVAHVQTQVDARGAELGGELLLRWNHPQRGSVPPSQFIPIAEESGLITHIGDWVIEQACVALAQLCQAGSKLCLSVNISPRQFRQEQFVDNVLAMLARTGAPAEQLIFEVTEGLFIEDWEGVAARMTMLCDQGIRFSIDDFGTGYSSFSYLRRLPLHEIKIDRSFVQDVPDNANGTAIVRSIIAVAKNLRLSVVAEGVESVEQAGFLAGNGCDCLQGYLYARPQPIQQWLAARLGSPPG